MELYDQTLQLSVTINLLRALTSAVFIPNPFTGNPNDLVYRTGDLGCLLDDDDFEFMGRADQQVKINGVRVELAEVETALRNHADVIDAAVVDLDKSDGEKMLLAFVVLRPGAAPDQLRPHLLESLLEPMVPSSFIAVDSLPKTMTGKIDRQLLRERAHALRKTGRTGTAPRSPLECRLARIFHDVLHVEAIGVDDSFFEAGGNSLSAIRAISRIRQELCVDLPLRALFEAPTVAGLAAAVSSYSGAPGPSTQREDFIEV